jgi:trehalose-phosphatase
VKHLFQSWRDFLADCRAVSHVLFLADYDGTLTPIVGRPEDAILSPEVRDDLSALAQRPDFTVGIISGRSMAELKSLVAIAGIYYAGNHGLEIQGPGINYVSPEAELTRSIIKDLAGQLAVALENIAGVIIQDKGLSLSAHYRLVAENDVNEVTETVHRITDPLVEAGKIKVYPMKKVWEIRPPVDWDKGKAVVSIRREIKSLLKLERLLTVYLGDDTTDEDAFKVLHRPVGWSVYVGPENASSAADYFLNSPAEVEEFLSRLLELR